MQKIAIVTGASRGIGREIAKTLATNGIKVIANYNKSEKEAIKLKEELEKENINIEIFKADVSKREDVKKIIEYVINKYGRIDILVNNAGISQYKLFTDITDEDWDNMIKNNLYSTFYMTQETVKHMIHEKSGCIINISSIWGIVGGSLETHYSASKGAINAFTKALAKELGPSNIRVNAVAPGAITTDMNKNLTEEELKDLESETPLGKIGKPSDIAKCVNWLIEDEFTTGQIISPNGGWVIT